jgi:predicted acetyltransferase
MPIYRSITQEELPLFADIQARGFRFDPQQAIDNLSRPEKRYELESCFVYEDEDRGAVAAQVVFNRGISVGGQLLETDMIASVSVPPDQRRRGYANGMLTAGLRRARERNLPLSILWPYSIPFYNRLGYGVFTTGNLLELPLKEMQNFDDMRLARRMTPDDMPAMQRLYQKEMKRHSGWINRTDTEWKLRIFANEGIKWPEKLEGVVIPGEDGELLGYLVYGLTYWNGTYKTCLMVYEWVDDYTNPVGFRAVAGYIAAQRAQANYMRYTAPLDFALHHTMGERYSHRTERPTEFIYRDMWMGGPGMMGRLVHAPEAFKQRGYPKEVKGACVVRIKDPQLPDNEKPFLLEIEDGKGYIFDKPAVTAFTATADIRTWSELYSNSLTARDAWRLGRLAADSVTVDFLGAAFASAPWFIHRADWF